MYVVILFFQSWDNVTQSVVDPLDRQLSVSEEKFPPVEQFLNDSQSDTKWCEFYFYFGVQIQFTGIGK